MKKSITNIKGSVSLEACIVVPIFMILMLFIYSFFIVFSAQNSISHALLQCSQSVSLDPYKTDKVGAAPGEIPDGLYNAIIEGMESDDTYFKSDSKWYTTTTDLSLADATMNIVTGGFLEAEEEVAITGLSSSELDEIVKKRFIAYLSGGDESKAKKELEALNIVNGLDGIVFTALVSGDDVYITATYEIEYVFSFQGAAKIPMTQTVCSRLWK